MNENSAIRVLRATDIFSEIPESVLLDSIPQMEVLHFMEGEVIIRKGETGDSMFILMSGEVKVHDEDFTVAVLGEGNYFGEMSLLQPAPRSMSVSATKPVEVILISQQSFYQILGHHPSLIQKVVGGLVNRLRIQNNTLVDEHKSREDELRKQVEIQTALYKEQKERAEKSEKFKQQFLANMSHEIRTPMNAVMGMTNLVLDSQLNPKQKFYLEGIKKSSDNLLYIINDILDLSKIEAGKMELENIDFSLSSTLYQVKQTLEHKAEEKGLELIVDIDPSIPDVRLGDPVRLNQVLINLAGNAIKFTERGSVSLEVKTSNGKIHFSIVDTGIGIPEGKLQTVFESFSQANASDSRNYGGTGLGLSISRQLVELMGGKISIKSKEGSGSTFSFGVSLEKGSPEKLMKRLASEERVDGAILDFLHILIIDDNEFNRIVARDTLEAKSKARVTAVGSADEGIRLLKEMNFDVVLMDVQMPVMNGFDCTRYIRENFEMPIKNIPIIALTASVLRTDLDKCKEAGMDSFIPKPFKASQLIIGIASVLNLKTKPEMKAEEPEVRQENFLIPITNLDYLSKFCEGDKARMKKYIDIFISESPSVIDTIQDALSKNDQVSIANHVHGFKTKLIMMGMNGTKDIALTIEKQCREGIGAEDLQNNVSLLFNHIRTGIQELVNFSSEEFA